MKFIHHEFHGMLRDDMNSSWALSSSMSLHRHIICLVTAVGLLCYALDKKKRWHGHPKLPDLTVFHPQTGPRSDSDVPAWHRRSRSPPRFNFISSHISCQCGEMFSRKFSDLFDQLTNTLLSIFQPNKEGLLFTSINLFDDNDQRQSSHIHYVS